MVTAELCLSVMNKTAAGSESDELLFRRFFDVGERAAMDALFARHVDSAYRIALAISGNAADAEDIVQTAFLQILTRGERSLRIENSNVRGWIMTVVVNAARMKMREESSRRAREQGALESMPQTSALLDPAHSELLDAARGSVCKLPALYRAPIVMHYIV